MARWLKLFGFLSWLILSLGLSYGAHAEIITSHMAGNEQRNSLQLRTSPRSRLKYRRQIASLEHKPLIQLASIDAYSSMVPVAKRKASSLANTLKTPRHDDIGQQHTLVRRTNGGKTPIPLGNQNPSQPGSSTPSSSKPSSSKSRSSKPSSSRVNLPAGVAEKPNSSKPSARTFEPLTGQSATPVHNALESASLRPLTNRAKEQAVVPGSFVAPFRDPLGVIKPAQSSSKASRLSGGPDTPKTSFSHGHQSPSYQSQRTERRLPTLEITPAPLDEPRRQLQTPRQSHEYSSPKREGSSRSLGSSTSANRQGAKPWQKNVGLTWDWASNNPRKACAAGAVILGGCASVAGIPMVAYGGGGLAKAVGVGLTIAGPAIATTAGTTVAVAGIGEYKTNEAITEQRQEDKWNEFLSKSRINRIPSVDQISQSIKTSPSVEKISSRVKSSSNLILDQLKTLNIFKKSSSDIPKESSPDTSRRFSSRTFKKSPSDPSASPGLDSLTIPEASDEAEAAEDMDATWSSPFPVSSQGKARNPRTGPSIQMKVFKKNQPSK